MADMTPREEVESLRTRLRNLNRGAKAAQERMVRSVGVAGGAYANGWARGKFGTKSKVFGVNGGLLAGLALEAGIAMGYIDEPLLAGVADGLVASEAALAGLRKGLTDAKEPIPAAIAGEDELLRKARVAAGG